MSYIKKELLLQIAKELQGKVFGSPLIVRVIEDAPEEDVIEVVRCGDCKHIEMTEYGGYCCANDEGVAYDGYCAFGERRAEDD